MEKAVLDRIVDGKHAVLLVGDKEEEKVVSSSRLPSGSKEGVWLKVVFEGNSLVSVELDNEETAAMEQRIQQKMALLRKKKGSQFNL